MGYTYGHLLPALVMIENPSATGTAHISSEDSGIPLLESDEKPDDLVQQELLMIQSKPITSSSKSTLKHLRAKAGRLSRFRGFSILLACATFNGVLWQGLSRTKSNQVIQSAVTIASGILLSHINMAWTHAVISLPSRKSNWARILNFKTCVRDFRQIVGLTSLYAVVVGLCSLIPIGLLRAFDLGLPIDNPQLLAMMDLETLEVFMVKYSIVCFAGLVIFLAVSIPASITLQRVQASLLPEEDEPIVPFDRSFGGRVVPISKGGSGRVGMKDAWTTFGWKAMGWLMILYVKLVALQLMLVCIFVLVGILELRLVVGPGFGVEIIKILLTIQQSL